MDNASTEKQLNRIVEAFIASEGEVRPHCIITGPSGSGKTHLFKSLAEKHDMPFIDINAAQLTKEGTAGNSLSKALAPLMNYRDQLVLVAVDEFDKLFISGNSNSELAHEVTHGVQNEFLKVLESDTTEVFGDYGKYNTASVRNVLFVFAGAFNNTENITVDKLRDFGVKTEFLGRVPLVYNLEKLSIEALRVILKSSKLLKDYCMLYPSVDKKTAVTSIMEVVESEYEKNTLGVRILNALTHQYFINNGKLKEDVIKRTTFQKTLYFDD